MQPSDAHEPTKSEIVGDNAQSVSKGGPSALGHARGEKRTKPRPGSLMDLLSRLERLS